MIFCYNKDRYHILKHSYLSEYKIGYGTFNSIKIDDKLSPFRPTAIDSSTYKTYIKVHQEHLERFRIAHNFRNEEYVQSFNPITKEIIKHKRDVIGYDFNEEYGIMDTTGTASGLKGDMLKEKALLELIEKNEAMLIWYSDMGYTVLINEYVKKLINRIGFDSENLFIFCSSNLCNLTTFLVLIFDEGKIVSTGVAIDKDTKIGLEKALLEAKLAETFYKDTEVSPYKPYTMREHNLTYRFVLELANNKKAISFTEDVQDEIVISPWIESIEFAILNTKSYQDYVTIRCFSKELINCVPDKNGILLSINKKIFKRYSINRDDILAIPPSIIL